jgi:hypothetical protein
VSVLLHPLVVGSLPILVARIGAAGSIDGRVCNSFVTNTWRCG